MSSSLTKRHAANRGEDAQLQWETILASGSRDELFAGLMDWLGRHPRILGAAFFVADSSGELELARHNMHGPAFDTTDLLKFAQQMAVETSQTGKRSIKRIENMRNVAMLALPLPVDGRRVHVLAAGIIGDLQHDPDDSPLQTAAAYARLWHARREHQQVRDDLNQSAALLDLLSRIEQSDTIQAGGMQIVNALRDHWNCQGVVLGLRKRPASRCQMVAHSGMAEFDSRSSRIHLLEQTLEECLLRDRLTEFPATVSTNRDCLLAHRKLSNELAAGVLVSHPLKSTAGEVIGAWLMLDEAPTSTSDRVRTFFQAASSRVADSLQLVRRADANPFGKRTRGDGRLRWIGCGVIAAALIAGVMIIPVPYRIPCDCAVEPEVRRFVSAPHEGMMEKAIVKPGDIVEAGQLLARMDGRDTRWELAGLAAEREKALKQIDAGLVAGDAASAQMAALEVARIESRQKVLRRRQEQLELKSPVDGVVLNGHLDRAENVPVQLGQALFEVAPLSPLTLEIALSAEDYSHAEVGFEVRVRFDGLAEEYTGRIARIHPRSEVREGDNVFIAEVNLENARLQLRPGMRGTARIHGRTHTLAWNLFHKPWEHLQKNLPF